MSKIIFNLQIVCNKAYGLPDTADFHCWLQSALFFSKRKIKINVRLVDVKESRKLNMLYRKNNYPTNVLSFSYDGLPSPEIFLGDVIICRQVVELEAIEQKKILKAHWAHMVIHGTLHLLGYNHVLKKEILEMESLETTIMKKLGYCNPYILNI
ncbi:rRNA maturation RNase YbeY [Candidatus Curculioniphilus buchneri]|uniref:rRNA maturation RNase YbeY n=1 Tax=Candidatus Curculioniphilus buchneri TaxID=690594 RepID=UPI00376EB3A6